MDQLASRYADPCFFMDGYIQTGMFTEFVLEFNQQRLDDQMWDYFLHKVWDKSYNDFREGLKVTQDLHAMSESTIEATVQKSMAILGNFNPDQEGSE